MEFQGNAIKKMYMLPFKTSSIFKNKFYILFVLLTFCIVLQNGALCIIGNIFLPNGTFELLLIVFAISTLLLAGVASKNASIEVQDKTRQAIGAGFLLERNAEYRTKRVREYSEKIGNDKEGSFGGYHQEKEIINGVETWTGWTTNEFERKSVFSYLSVFRNLELSDKFGAKRL